MIGGGGGREPAPWGDKGHRRCPYLPFDYAVYLTALKKLHLENEWYSKCKKKNWVALNEHVFSY